MDRTLLNLLYCLVASLLLSACSEQEVFYEFRSLPDAAWDKSQPLMFEVLVEDTLRPLDLYVEVRNNDQYPFRNLWLFIDQQSPKGVISKDTLNIYLADIYGKWNGSGLSLYTLTSPYKEQLVFPDSGIYTYTIRQGMRRDILPGISDVGMRLKK